jgi:hypothetical protein
MSKTDAVIELMREEAKEKTSNTAARRIRKACRILEIEDPLRIFQRLGYCDSQGAPYSDKIECIWF